MNDLQNKIALVTGSSRGLGKGIALALAEKGADVIINYLPSEDYPADVVMEIEKRGSKAIVLEADVSRPGNVALLFEQIRLKAGRLDILINNAGISQAKDIFETEPEDWQHILEVNLSSGFYCSRKAMEMMRDQGRGGRIVFVSSMVAHQGALFGHVHYAASKSGQLGMMKTLARTGAPLGITVNAVAPGVIQTELLTRTHGEKGVSQLAGNIPLGIGRPEDVGNAVAFLCSDNARYITGATLDVNGGMYLR